MSAITVCIENSFSQANCEVSGGAFDTPQASWDFIVQTAKAAITKSGQWAPLLSDAVDNGLDEYSFPFDDGTELWAMIDIGDNEECQRYAEALLSDHNILFWVIDHGVGFDVSFKRCHYTVSKLAEVIPQDIKLSEVYDEIFYIPRHCHPSYPHDERLHG